MKARQLFRFKGRQDGVIVEKVIWSCPQKRRSDRMVSNIGFTAVMTTDAPCVMTTRREKGIIDTMVKMKNLTISNRWTG
jgi:hypothetical protein